MQGEEIEVYVEGDLSIATLDDILAETTTALSDKICADAQIR